MYQSLYRRYRPQTFRQVIGQAHIVRVLRAAVTKDRVAHAYFFSGPRGTGKTTMARLLAKAVNCEKSTDKKIICDQCDSCRVITEGRSLDVIEIDAASNNGVEDVRALRERIQFPPQELKKKIYIIDEIHMLSKGAFNALLKTLEEPPAHAMFILATTEPQKVPITIQSRCQRLDFHRASDKHLVTHLAKIAEAENLAIDEAALELVAALSEGSFRDSLTLLERLLQEETTVTAERAREVLGLGSDQMVQKIITALLDFDRPMVFSCLDEAMARGVNPPYLARSILDNLRRLMYIHLSVVKSSRAWDQAQAEKTDVNGWRKQLQYWQEATIASRTAPIAVLPLEIAAAFWLEQVPAEPVVIKAEQTIAEPAPAAEPAPSAEATPSAESASSAESLPVDVEKWREILAELISFNHSLTKLLEQAAVGGVSSGKVPVYVQYPFHAETLKKKVNQDAVAKAFAKVLHGRIVPEFHVGQAPAEAIRLPLTESAATSLNATGTSATPVKHENELLQTVHEVFQSK